MRQRKAHLVSCFPEACGRPGVFSLKIYHAPELALYDMRNISPVNRCGTTHLGSRACSLLVLCACLLLFLVHFQGIAMMKTLNWGIHQCIKYVVMHLRVKCNYTDREREKRVLRVAVGEKKTGNFLFLSPSELSIISDNVETTCHYFSFLMNFSCILYKFVFVM